MVQNTVTLTNICNKLNKLNPPSFVTTGTSHKRSVVQKWSSLVTQSQYKVMSPILISEINILTGYIERKGTQLRLEKALMLTKQIQKLAQRWRTNDFYAQLLQFQRSIGDFDESTGYLQSDGIKKDRLPSTQWSNWVMYLALRDSALLAKISLECENTIKFWFGLIASGHHWGDSLVVCGILARIWFLSNKLVDDFTQVIYPYLFEISALLQPNKSPTWPDPNFLPPSNLQDWICNSMKLPFVSIDASRDFRFTPGRKKKTYGPSNLSFLKNYFLPGGLHYETLNGSESDIEEPDFDPTELVQEFMHQATAETPTNIEMDDEDIGIAVDITEVPVIKKRKKVQGKNNGGKKKKLQQIKANTNSTELEISSDFNTEESTENNGSLTSTSWKEVKSHWRKFFLNVNDKLESAEGRKKLLNRIKKFSRIETDAKLQIKLKKLKKLVLQSEGGDERPIKGFSNLQVFVNKHVKQLKKQGNNI